MFGTLTPIAQEFETLRQAMDRMVDQAVVGGPFRTLWSQTASGMPLDAYGTDDEVVVVAALPGVKPDDFEVTVHQNTITLSGTIDEDAQGVEGATWYVRELPSGQFRRSLTLPFEVDADKAEATFAHGIAKIVLPKAEYAKPKKIAISGGTAQAIGAGSSK
jgi:HSP20 family protein